MFGDSEMNCVADAITTAVHQSETGEIHGDFDFLVDVVCHEYGWGEGQKVRDFIAALDLEKLLEKWPVEFFRAMDGSMHFVDVRAICEH
ncbi:hypothetical protein [Pseudomonas indica]|uniref:hypothetical protein n=1 Tax=Pseudomonas indica TaxID=137658 RepID=UPI0023F6911B|nr:hypothetical protein [Pseudomonas indica]MBU3055848.1 hypothetical protein [Pseudomonas indica]